MAAIELDSGNWQKITTGNTPVLVDFWAPWCPWCMRLMPVFEEASGQYNDKLIFAKINVEEQESVAKANDISGIPIMKMFYNGKKIGDLVGYMTKDKLVQGIDAMLASFGNYSTIENKTRGKCC
ncbi:MAG TPA: thioredoxin family protein [Candidatus Nitrosotalea sp.]|nr:thioredoxin family protein [Candidatus Nitrosotalea sp.]